MTNSVQCVITTPTAEKLIFQKCQASLSGHGFVTKEFFSPKDARFYDSVSSFDSWDRSSVIDETNSRRNCMILWHGLVLIIEIEKVLFDKSLPRLSMVLYSPITKTVFVVEARWIVCFMC